MMYGQVRVLKAHVELAYKLKEKLRVTAAIIPWLILHAVWLLNRWTLAWQGHFDERELCVESVWFGDSCPGYQATLSIAAVPT